MKEVIFNLDETGDLVEFTGNIADLQKSVAELKIVDQASYNAADAILNLCKKKVKGITDKLAPNIKKAYELHKGLTTARAEELKPFETMVNALDLLMKRFLIQQKEAGLKAQKLIDDARAAELRAQQEEEDSRRRQAEKLREIGAAEAAAQIEAAPVPVVMPAVQVVAQTSPVTGGSSVKWPWTATCTDPMELIKAIADGRVPLYYDTRKPGEPILEVNEALVAALGKQRQADFNLPGCVSREEPQIARKR